MDHCVDDELNTNNSSSFLDRRSSNLIAITTQSTFTIRNKKLFQSLSSELTMSMSISSDSAPDPDLNTIPLLSLDSTTLFEVKTVQFDR